jgi:hypothetical protein
MEIAAVLVEKRYNIDLSIIRSVEFYKGDRGCARRDQEDAELERVLSRFAEVDDDQEEMQDALEGLGGGLPRLSLQVGDALEDDEDDADFEVDGRPASRCSHRNSRRHSSPHIEEFHEKQIRR